MQKTRKKWQSFLAVQYGTRTSDLLMCQLYAYCVEDDGLLSEMAFLRVCSVFGLFVISDPGRSMGAGCGGSSTLGGGGGGVGGGGKTASKPKSDWKKCWYVLQTLP